MEINRKRFEGISNILRFNWHIYAMVWSSLVLCSIILVYVTIPYKNIIWIALALSTVPIFISLFVSYYIYDYSNLYSLPWTDNLNDKKILNIHAGFDETSSLLYAKYKNANIIIADFYDAKKHTEISIKRARKIQAPLPNTIKVSTTVLPFDDNSFDYVHIAFAAHEIREEEERISFFKEINRITKITGKIAVTEHLRDVNNFLAYTIGFFHFYAKNSWKRVFRESGLIIKEEIKTTAFISTFNLQQNGSTL